MSGYVPIIDGAVYQLGGSQTPGAHNMPTDQPLRITMPSDRRPDLAKAKALGVRGVLWRASNAEAIDPSYRLVAENCAAIDLPCAPYHYMRPDRIAASAAFDIFERAVLAAPAPTLPPMLDVENFTGQERWTPRQIADYMLEWLRLCEARLGRRPITYIPRWWSVVRLQDLAAEFAGYDNILSSYVSTTEGPIPSPDQWWQWASARPTPADIPQRPGWQAWQFTSNANGADYGLVGKLDCNVVRGDVWSRWTESAGPAPEPSPFPLPQPAPAPAPPEEAPVADTLYPVGYGTALVSIDKCLGEAVAHHHPEFVRRLRAWLIAQGGEFGIGDAWRATGTQPDKPGFAPEGKSFHQDQKWSDGFVGGAAVDLVVRNGTGKHRSPNWSEVPRQGSKEAAKWGLHCNIDSEAWHMQPVEVDGHASWVAAGRPSPKRGYPLPTVEAPAPAPKPAPTPERYVTVEGIPELKPNANAQRGWHVEVLQIALNRYNMQSDRVSRPQIAVTGIYDLSTIARVAEFQVDKGLKADQIVGPSTWRAVLTGAAR